jgi:aminopeptidase N
MRLTFLFWARVQRSVPQAAFTCRPGKNGYNSGNGRADGGDVINRLLLWCLGLALWLSGCVPVLRPAPELPSATPAIGLQESATPEPSRPAPSTPSPASTARPWDEWSTYLAALRPQAKPATAELEEMTQYHLDLRLASDLSRLEGQADIQYSNREQLPLDRVYLHLFPNLWDDGMTVSNAEVRGRQVSPDFPSGDDIVGLSLDPPLQPGESVDLALRFTTPIPSREGVGNYGELANQGDVVALAHFYPTVMVNDGSWRTETPSSQGDVIYHDASLYDITLTAPEGMTVVATGTSLGKADNGDGTSTWRLVGGPMRDFNIVASGKYQSASKQVGDVAVNSYFLPEDAASGKQALEWASSALQSFEQEFGAYPYHELDIAATSTSAGGIEYPGLVVLATWLFDDPRNLPFFEAAAAHEVAHQWWYNVVGNDQVNQPWLDEGLAQYSAYLYYRDVYGEAGAKGFEDSLRRRWQRVDYAERPVGLPVGDYQDKEYGAIVYGRAGLFFLALRDQIGEEKMAELLRRYYSESAWDVVTSQQFQALAETVSGEDLGALFDKWVYPK